MFNKYWYKKQLPDHIIILNNGYFLYMHYLTKGRKMMLSPHPLFNVRYYFKKYGSSFNKNIDPVTHFIKFGSEKSYNPSSMFDTSFYRNTYPIIDKENALIHFIKTGAELGYAPNQFFLEAQKIEPTISFSTFSNKSGKYGYIIPDKNKIVRAFKEVFTKYIKCKPDYIFIVDSQNLQLFQEFLNSYYGLFNENKNKVLVIVTDRSLARTKQAAIPNVSYVFLSELSIRLNKKRKILLLIRLLVQLNPALIHFYDFHSFQALISTYQKQLSQISSISVTLSQFQIDIHDTLELYSSVNHVFTKSEALLPDQLKKIFKGNIFLYPINSNEEQMNQFREQLVKHYIQ